MNNELSSIIYRSNRYITRELASDTSPSKIHSMILLIQDSHPISYIVTNITYIWSNVLSNTCSYRVVSHIKPDVLYKVSKLSLPYTSQTPNLCVTCQGIKTFTDLINGCHNQCVVFIQS